MFAVSRTNLVKELRSRSCHLGLTGLCQPKNDARSEALHMSPTKGSMWDATVKETQPLTKPPNILIFHGNNQKQNWLRQLVTSVVGTTNYTIYDLPVEEPTVWMDNTSLVVVAGELNSNVSLRVERYLQKGGAVLSLTSTLKLLGLASDAVAMDKVNCDVLLTYGDHINVSSRYSDCGLRQFEVAPSDITVNLRHPVKVSLDGPKPREDYCSMGNEASTNQHKTAHDPTLFSPRSDGTLEGSRVEKSALTSSSSLSSDEQNFLTSAQLSYDSSSAPSFQCPVIWICSYPTSGGRVLVSQLAWDEASSEQMALIRCLLQQELGVKCDDPAGSDEVTYQLGYVVADGNMISKLRTQPPLPGPLPALQFVTSVSNTSASAESLPIIASTPPQSQFNTSLYHKHLNTKSIGRYLVYLPTVTSSLDVLKDPRLPHGAAVVCDRQTKGRGRSGNTWLSPPGCCMLALKLQVDLNSSLGDRLTWLQHIITLAVVLAVEDPRLGLKWPNDLYWDRRVKVGGALAETSIMGREVVCRLGLGVNLDNAAPTACLNSRLATPISREALLAGVFNNLERLLTLAELELIDLYRLHWIHEGQRVTVLREGQEVKALVSGLDEYGFLVVRSEDGTEQAVRPDGNSFDMMRGLIIHK